MKRFHWANNGKAKKENLICGKKFRITMLTDRLIRFEFDENGRFEDRATQHIINRNLPKTKYTVTENKGALTIETQYLTITYNKEKAFAGDSLSIVLKDKPYTRWNYGDKLQNLKGTYRTLDRTDGAIPLEDGVCSRDGIAVVDDSDCLVLDGDWFALRNPETDFYVFAYGHDYRAAVKALFVISGEPMMLPDYALGNWWSRYYEYSEKEYIELMEKFEHEKLPFSVAVIDMDWHRVTDVPEDEYTCWPNMLNSKGWTGYSWNKELFPDYKRFLKWLHKHNLHTTLNLHPAQGVRYFEDMYEQMCEAVGQDPKTKQPVKLDLLNPKFMENYFDIIHHPYEEGGVDFWWMDWQQGTNYWWIHDENHKPSELEKMDPLWLLNHLHILDISRNGKRPMFFSRYAGVGSQRYPIGFSGDTTMDWPCLDFQPYFTNTATNIGYTWWSHDIGGHMFGCRDDEMVTRWIQYGVFNPINRWHSTKNEFTNKEPWHFGKEDELVQKDFLRLRHKLFPYLYTMNYRTATDGRALVEPIYYEWPESYEAYEYKNQYLFGSELMVAPVTSKSDSATKMGRVKTLFPDGTPWFDFFLGLKYDGGQELDVYRYINEYPVFAKAGAIVPMQADLGDNKLGRSKSLELVIFPGASGSFTMYEDEGDYDNWKKGAYATTRFAMKWGRKPVITIEPAKGDASLIPAKRDYKLVLRGWAGGLSVSCGGKKLKTIYDADTNTTEVVLKNVVTASGASLEISGENLIADKSAALRRAKQILRRAQGSNLWKKALIKEFEAGVWYFDNNGDEWHVMNAMREMSGPLKKRGSLPVGALKAKKVGDE